MSTTTLTHQSPPLVTDPSDDAEAETWTVIFVIAVDLSDRDRARILKTIDTSAAFVDTPAGLRLSVGAVGPMDEALAIASASVRDVLGDGPGVIGEVRMVAHRNVDSALAADRAITYYGVTECAHALGVSRQRVNQLRGQDKLPAPDAIAGDKPLWRSDTFERFAYWRRNQIDRTPTGMDPGRLDAAD